MKKSILFFIFSFSFGVLFHLASAGMAGEDDLVDLAVFDPRIRVELKYATENNFTGRRLMDMTRCLLRRESAEKLKKVQDDLEKKGYGLKVFDAYRPLSVQAKLWEAFPDERYVTPPDKGPDHCRGAAVDVTLVDEKGEECDMGSAYDEFTRKSRPDCFGLPYEVLERRVILKKIMEKHGFLQSRTEWWHFYDSEWASFPVIAWRRPDRSC